jgi:hypothetical protein
LVIRGHVHLAKGDRKRAFEDFDRAIADYGAMLKVSSRSASSLYGRGRALLAKGEQAAGDADISAAQAIDPVVSDVMERGGVRLEWLDGGRRAVPSPFVLIAPPGILPVAPRIELVGAFTSAASDLESGAPLAQQSDSAVADRQSSAGTERSHGKRSDEEQQGEEETEGRQEQEEEGRTATVAIRLGTGHGPAGRRWQEGLRLTPVVGSLHRRIGGGAGGTDLRAAVTACARTEPQSRITG